MTKEEAMCISQEAVVELEKVLSQGKPESLQRYLDQMAVFHNYSFLNQMMILAQRPDASHVAGFHTWRKLGRWVKADEKGIAIYAPLVFRKSDKETSSQDSEQNSEKAAKFQRALCGFRVVHVFDLSQTDGKPMSELSTPIGEPGETLPHLFQFSETSGIKVLIQPLPSGSHGVSKGGLIVLRPGLSASEQFSVLAHELAHEFLHQVNGKAKRTRMSQAEVEAESVSYVVCRAFGIDCRLPAAEYIHLFMKTEKDNLLEHFERIRDTASRIILGVKASSESAKGTPPLPSVADTNEQQHLIRAA